MPVSVLYCEGEPKGPDVRLIAALLRGVAQVEARHGRTAVPAAPARGQLCLLDGDFPEQPDRWVANPPDALVRLTRNGEHIGWRWQRKEIENYLLDVVVLGRAHRWGPDRREAWSSVVEVAAGRIEEHTAARLAWAVTMQDLSPPQSTHLPLSSARPGPAQSAEAACRAMLQGQIDKLKDRFKAIDGVWDRFELYLPVCRAGGALREHARDVFAGKDLRAVIFQDVNLLRSVGMQRQGWPSIQERVLNAVEEDAAPWQWLPEWTALREAVVDLNRP